MSNQKIPISSFELYFPEEIILSGEKIVDSITTLNFTNPEPNLYTTEVSGKEIEIDCTLNYLRRSTCECPQHSAREACKHVVAALLVFRRQRKAKVKIKKTASVPQKVTITNILKQLSREDMELFIKQQTYHDKAMATNLKIQYAYKIPLDNEKAKYENLLTTIFRPFISKPNLSERKAKDLASYLSRWFDHIYDLIVMKKWTDAVYLSVAIARKARFIHVKSHFASLPALEDLTIGLSKLFEHIFKLALPPDLKRVVHTELSEIVSSPNYRTINPLQNLYVTLIKSCRNNKELNELVNFPQAGQLSDTEIDKLLALYLMKDLTSQSLSLPSLNRVPNKQIKSLLLGLYKAEHYPVLESIIVKLITLPYSIEFKTLCFQYLKELPSSPQNYPPDLFFSLWSLYTETLWSVLGSWLLEHDPGKMKNSEEFIRKIAIKKDIKSILALAKVFIGTQKLNMLNDLLKDEIENRLLQKLIPDLFDKFSAPEMHPFFEGILDHYLSTHLGTKPWYILDDILQQIRKQGELDMADRLYEFLTVKYKDRTSVVMLK